MEPLDRHIVTVLAQDGRISFADLGRQVGLSTSAVHQRVRRLEERGIITGYRAVVDYASVGLPLTALMSVTPFDPSDDEKRAFETFLRMVDVQRSAHPGMHIYHYAPYEPTHLLAMAARYGVGGRDGHRADEGIEHAIMLLRRLHAERNGNSDRE